MENMSENQDWTEEKIKEEVKSLRKLAKKLYLHRSIYDRELKQPKLTKKTAEELITLKEKPYYKDYYKFGKPIVDVTRQKHEQQLSQFPNELQSIPIERVFEVEDLALMRRDLFEKLVNEKLSAPKVPQFDIPYYRRIDEYELQYLHDHPNADRDEIYQNRDIYYKKFDEYITKNPKEKERFDQWQKEREEWDEKVKQLWDVKSNIYNDIPCIVEPTDTIETVKNTECNYGKILERFIEEFKGEKKKEQKKKEWQKKYIGKQSIQNYHQLLKTMVNKDEVKREVQNGFIRYYERQTENAVNNINNTKKYLDQIESQREALRNQSKINSKEYKELYQQYNQISQQYSNMKELIRQFWNPKQNTFNMQQIQFQSDIDTEETIENFVTKNTEKMSPILSGREDCDEFIPNLKFSQGIIEGDIHIKCKENNDEFRVNNQLVYVPEGERIAHYRFPTTFHDILFDSQFHKMEPEEWMNTQFTKKKK